MKRFIYITILALILANTNGIVYGQDTIKCNSDYFNDSLLEKLVGNWTATGSIGGDKVFYNFSIQWVLNHQFLEMTITDTLPKPEYTAKVFIGYDCPKAKYVVHWIDKFGGKMSETLGYGQQKKQSIEILFEYPRGHFINTFSYDKKNDSWTSHSVSKDNKGDWVPFGQIYLERVN